MRCDFCDSENASISLIKIIDNRIEKINVCTKCIKKLTLSTTEDFVEDVADMLSKIFEVDISSKDDLDSKFFKLVSRLDKIGDQKCSSCDIKLSTVKKLGRMGCSRCYKSFREGLIPLLEAIHGSSEYKGRLPQKIDEGLKLKREIEELKYKLREEIFVENFEEAAKLKDTIDRLERRLNSGKKVKRL